MLEYAPFAFDAAAIGEVAKEYGPYLLGVLFVIVIALYGLAYLSRGFHKLKMRESRYIDYDTLDFLQRALSYVAYFIAVVLIFFILQLKFDWIRDDIWEPLLGYLPSIFGIIIIVISISLVVRFFHHFFGYLRSAQAEKPTKEIHQRTLLYIELAFVYIIYIIGVFLVFLIALNALNLQGYVDAATQFLADNMVKMAFIAILILLAYFLPPTFDSFLDEWKKHSARISHRIIEMTKLGVRYSIYLLALWVIFLTVLSIAGLPTEVIALLFMTLVLTIAIILVGEGNTLKNVSAGITITTSGLFDKGDRVRIADGVVCDVVELDYLYTRVQTPDGEIIEIPNSQIATKLVVNYTRAKTTTVSFDVEVEYSVAHAKVEEMLLQAAESVEEILEMPKPKVFSRDFGKNTIKYQLVTYTDKPKMLKRIKSNLIAKTQEVFFEEGVSLVFQE